MDATEGKSRLTIVFMGTPGFARTALESLVAYEDGEVVAVYTQPDRPCGRGRACKPSEVKTFALEQGLPVYQPENFKDDATVAELKALGADILVVAAYGLILPERVLLTAPKGAVNIHASLLPKYRGAAPIQRSILNGDPITGVTIMQMDKGMDTGDIIMQRALGVDVNETAEDVHDQLAELGGTLIREALDDIRAGQILRIPQDDDIATYAPKLEKSEGEIDWSQPVWDVHCRVRAMHPWPGAFFMWQGERKKKPIRLVLSPGFMGPELADPKPEPGTILGVRDDKLAIATADKEYLIPSIKPAGKKLMDAEAFACGYLGDCCCLD